MIRSITKPLISDSHGWTVNGYHSNRRDFLYLSQGQNDDSNAKSVHWVRLGESEYPQLGIRIYKLMDTSGNTNSIFENFEAIRLLVEFYYVIKFWYKTVVHNLWNYIRGCFIRLTVPPLWIYCILYTVYYILQWMNKLRDTKLKFNTMLHGPCRMIFTIWSL